jgi:hypothetical protein
VHGIRRASRDVCLDPALPCWVPTPAGGSRDRMLCARLDIKKLIPSYPAIYRRRSAGFTKEMHTGIHSSAHVPSTPCP